MAFRLNRHESVSHGLRRVTRKEVRAALDAVRTARALTPSTLHALRKRVKRIRALLRLCQHDAGRGLRRRRRRLRDACLPLSPIRDLDAMRATLADLARLDSRVLPAHDQRDVQARLRRDRRLLIGSYRRDGVVADIGRALKDVSTQIDRWHPDDGDVAALLPRLRRSHERCRAALRRVTRDGHDADYHEWRRCITTLRNQLRLFDDRAPRVQAAVVALDAAAHALGEDHNLVVLRDTLASWAAENGTALHSRLLRLIASRQRTLRKTALQSAGALCRRTSNAFVRSLEDDSA
jgi:CHAD domain-containing protein